VAKSVALLPAHTVAEVTTIVGVVVTLKVIAAVDEHAPLLPVTVYEVVDVGPTVTTEPVKVPGFHV
jgi:hypothetical protein